MFCIVCWNYSQGYYKLGKQKLHFSAKLLFQRVHLTQRILINWQNKLYKLHNLLKYILKGLTLEPLIKIIIWLYVRYWRHQQILLEFCLLMVNVKINYIVIWIWSTVLWKGLYYIGNGTIKHKTMLNKGSDDFSFNIYILHLINQLIDNWLIY